MLEKGWAMPPKVVVRRGTDRMCLGQRVEADWIRPLLIRSAALTEKNALTIRQITCQRAISMAISTNFREEQQKSPPTHPTMVGPPSGIFAMPKTYADQLIANSGGDTGKPEVALGLNHGDPGTNPHES